MMKKVIVVRPERCLACRSCQLACAVAHSGSKDLVGALSEDPRPLPRVSVERVEEFVVPLQCRHCEDAPCLAICPTGAISRTDDSSPVLVNPERCIGCRWCVLVCPFGVMRVDPTGKAVLKCDLCIERLEAGEEPACVDACPTGALQFRLLDEVLAEKRRIAAGKLVAEAEQQRTGVEEE